jgi:hypothetical protein
MRKEIDRFPTGSWRHGKFSESLGKLIALRKDYS